MFSMMNCREMVESIEEEIIEDFLDGTLDSADKDAVDRYFLRPPERKEKLRFARLLRHHFEEQHELVGARSDAIPSADTNVIRESSDYRAPIPWRSHFRTYGQLAALVLLSVVSLIYISGVRKNQARLEGPARARARAFRKPDKRSTNIAVVVGSFDFSIGSLTR